MPFFPDILIRVFFPALIRLRNTPHVDAELDEMKQERIQERATATNEFHFTQLFSKELRFPLIISVVLQIAQQWSGINAVSLATEFLFLHVAGIF